MPALRLSSPQRGEMFIELSVIRILFAPLGAKHSCTHFAPDGARNSISYFGLYKHFAPNGARNFPARESEGRGSAGILTATSGVSRAGFRLSLPLANQQATWHPSGAAPPGTPRCLRPLLVLPI